MWYRPSFVHNTGHLVHTLMVSHALQAHRDGCMCIICKQARRVGKTWGGMSGMPGGPKWQGPMITGGGRQGQPVPRFGKRAFLHALPHLVCGPLQHKVVYLPFASCIADFCRADMTGFLLRSVACPSPSALQRMRLLVHACWGDASAHDLSTYPNSYMPEWLNACLRLATPQCLSDYRAWLHEMQVWKLPESKAWSPDEWLVAKGHQVEEAAATPAAEPTPSVKLEGTTRRGSLIRQSSAPTPAPAATQDAAQAKAGAKAAGTLHVAAMLPRLMFGLV